MVYGRIWRIHSTLLPKLLKFLYSLRVARYVLRVACYAFRVARYVVRVAQCALGLHFNGFQIACIDLMGL